ncbi:DoxX family membrane protein [Geothrix sp. 21YS21S-2]|uniref:DoxX family membrane protein n=1 Tax=Geothrix sp. 21YS21S-2 TaxID=3068893 RepID=UPI0027BAA0D1|nr:DoxX family membrane protein [Geothrix sp. 21YS21S-2]
MTLPRFLSQAAPIAARLVLGLLFTVTGLNGFLDFLPRPTAPMPEGAAAFAGAMMKTGYLLQLVAGTQVVAGVLLLLGRFVPLALTLLAPVIVNIICFHVFLLPSGIGPGMVALVLELYMAWTRRAAFRTLFG